MARKIIVGQRAVTVNAFGNTSSSTDGALLISSDNGSTWVQYFGGGSSWQDVYNITATSDYSYIYVASQAGLYVTTNKGTTWTPSSGSGKYRNIQNVTNAVVSNNKLWVSEGGSVNNSGGLYSASSLELNGAQNSGFGTVVDYISSKSIKSTFLYGNNLYVVGTDASGGVIYIINTTAAAPSTIYTGSAYVYQNTNTSRPNNINDVYVNANGIYLATDSGLYICTDLVPTVSSVFTKIYDPGIYDVVRKIRYYNNTIYLATGQSGLLYATDNGASTANWTARTTTSGLRQNYIKGLHVDSSGIYVGYGSTSGVDKGMSRSTNNGASWTTTLYNNSNGTPNANVYAILSFEANSTPTNITLSTSYVAENQPSGTTVGTLTTTDADAGDTFTYSLSGTDAASFSITGSTLKTAAVFNYETKSSYSISITTTDSAGATYTKPFTITVTNVNEAPTNITLSSSSVAEGQAIGTTIGTLSTIDPDAGNTFSYTLGGTDAASFSITGNALKTASVFDYETKASYSISITSTDQGGLAYTKAFTISVTNVNEAPTNITLSSSSVAENQPSGTIVGSFSATDPDASSSFTYSLSGTDASSFSVVGNVLKTAVEFNYETKSSYSINVTASDGSLTYTKAFTISVTNVNEAPTNVTLSSLSIMENQPSGTTVGTLSTTDPDAGNTFTYTVGGTDAGFFNIVGNSLKTAAVFDYEVKNSYSISVTAQDQGGLSYTKAFTISVLNDTSDDTVQLSSSNSVDLSSGITFAAVAVDPRTIPVLKNGNALPTDSVVRNTVTGQKFLKVAGSATAFMAIEVVPPVEWGWDQSAIDAWAILQSL